MACSIVSGAQGLCSVLFGAVTAGSYSCDREAIFPSYCCVCFVTFVGPHRSIEPFYLHQWLDVLDSKQRWLEAAVTQLEYNRHYPEHVSRIYIHYKGYKAAFDEWVNVSEGHEDLSRIALVNTHSTPAFGNSPLNELEMKLVPGSELDVLDTADKWYHANVVEVDHVHEMVKVSYQGWPSKYDEVRARPCTLPAVSSVNLSALIQLLLFAACVFCSCTVDQHRVLPPSTVRSPLCH